MTAVLHGCGIKIQWKEQFSATEYKVQILHPQTGWITLPCPSPTTCLTSMENIRNNGLKLGSKIYIQVAAINTSGMGKFSAPSLAKVRVSGPAAPVMRPPRIVQSEENEIVIDWESLTY